MKVAILSMQEVKNYGSFLQAYSLKNNIEALGHTCDFINIVPGEQPDGFKQSKFHKINVLLKRLWGWDFIKRFKAIYYFQTRFSKEFFPMLGVKPGPNMQHYDTVVIGSDEVFNCTQKTWFGFAPQLFGENINADKVITYAASFGATTVDKLNGLALKTRIAELLKQLNSISVRDANSSDTVQALTGIKPVMHLDPVFIYNYEKLMPAEVPLKDYMIVYTYPGRITDKTEINAIKQFAESHHLKIISIGHYFSWCDKALIPKPFEVLSYFKNAEYIVTDTFHGSIYSIKFNKPFCTIIRKMNNQKLTHLLHRFNLDDRIVNETTDLTEILQTPKDYSSVNKIINDETKHSLQYLAENI